MYRYVNLSLAINMHIIINTPMFYNNIVPSIQKTRSVCSVGFLLLVSMFELLTNVYVDIHLVIIGFSLSIFAHYWHSIA